MTLNQDNEIPIKQDTEFAHLWKLGLPLMGSQLAQMAMGVLDTVMAGRLGAAELAGIALGGAVLWPVTLLLMGFLQAVTPTVAQFNGARIYGAVGEVIRQALWMALIASVIICAVITHIGPFYVSMGVDPAASDVAIPYLKATAWGVPALMGYFVLRFLAEGMGFTRPGLYIAVGALLLKIPLNFIFMYGYFGAPALGGVGCGVATAIVMWFELLFIMIVVVGPRFKLVRWQSQFSWPSFTHIWRLSKIGAPIGATIFMEMGMFSLTTLFLGRLGAETVASHTIAGNLGGITYMLPLALGMAGTIRVGYNVGAKRIDRARETALAAMKASLTVAIVAGILIVVFREQIANLYSNDAKVIAIAVNLMLFVAVYQIFDDTQATALGVLRGYKDTQAPMWITFFGYWIIGLPLGYALGFGVFTEPYGIYGFWAGILVGLAVVSGLINLRLWFTSRNEQLVIQLSGSHHQQPIDVIDG
jgi:MATE family multidrug resistance protein